MWVCEFRIWLMHHTWRSHSWEGYREIFSLLFVTCCRVPGEKKKIPFPHQVSEKEFSSWHISTGGAQWMKKEAETFEPYWWQRTRQHNIHGRCEGGCVSIVGPYRDAVAILWVNNQFARGLKWRWIIPPKTTHSLQETTILVNPTIRTDSMRSGMSSQYRQMPRNASQQSPPVFPLPNHLPKRI